MRLPINKVAHGIGMQNQYLGQAVWDNKVNGEVVNGNYHSDKSWVDIESVKEYLKWKFENYVISKEQFNKAMDFLNELTK